MNWISVDNRLPCEEPPELGNSFSQLVIASFDGVVLPAWFGYTHMNRDRWEPHWTTTAGIVSGGDTPTHWMPIPPPPTAEEEPGTNG